MSPYDTETIFFAANLVEKWETGDELEIEQLTLLGELPSFAGPTPTSIAVRPDTPMRVVATVQGRAAQITDFHQDEILVGKVWWSKLILRASCSPGSIAVVQGTQDWMQWRDFGAFPIGQDGKLNIDIWLPEGAERFQTYGRMFVRIKAEIPSP